MTDNPLQTSYASMAQKQADYCHIFSNPRRVMILWMLLDGEKSVGTLAEGIGSTLQNVSQHLSLLKDAQIVSTRRDGQTIYYRLDDQAVSQRCMGMLNERMSMVRADAAKTQTQPNVKGK